MKPNALETKSGALELREGRHRLFVKSVDEDGVFDGYGSVFDVKDSYDEVIAHGAFSRTLGEHRERGTLPAMLWGHDAGKPIGVFTEMYEDEKGLFVRGNLCLDVQQGKEAYALLRIGALNGLSIGFMPTKNGSSYDEASGIRTLTDLDLWEVSLVLFPANDSARVEGVKSLNQISKIESISEFERHLRDVGGYSNNAATAMVARIKKLLSDEREVRNAKADIIAGADRISALLKT